MRVFVAGASGAIGTRLVPQLIDRGHEVVGTATSPTAPTGFARSGRRRSSSTYVDARAVRRAVVEEEPDAIVHEATALANVRFSKDLDSNLVQTNRCG
jgi:2-alkyl-3-oxoalkanoate reductase